jgi:hypothetical protein
MIDAFSLDAGVIDELQRIVKGAIAAYMTD